MMANANTKHSRKLRAESSRRAHQKARDEGRIKSKTLRAAPDVIDAFVAHLNATGGKTDAEKLKILNKQLDKGKE